MRVFACRLTTAHASRIGRRIHRDAAQGTRTFDELLRSPNRGSRFAEISDPGSVGRIYCYRRALRHTALWTQYAGSGTKTGLSETQPNPQLRNRAPFVAHPGVIFRSTTPLRHPHPRILFIA